MSDSKLNAKKPDKTHLEVIEVLTEYCGIGCEIPHKNVCVVREVDCELCNPILNPDCKNCNGFGYVYRIEKVEEK